MIPEAAPPAPRRRRVRHGLVSAAGLATIVAGPACASEADIGATQVETDGGAVAADFEATAAFLHQAAAQSTAEGYRVEMRMSFTGEVDEGATPLMSGEVEDDSYHYVMDMGSMMEEMSDMMGGAGDLPPEIRDLDLSIEMAGDSQAFYLRAPMFADLGGAGDLGPAAGLAEMGDGWGHVDVAAVGDEVSADVASALGGQGVDPRAVVETIEGTADVEDIGTAEIRGAPVRGLAAEVTMGDLLEASGQDPEVLAETTGVGRQTEEMMAALYATTTPIEVWVDDDGYLRRMVFGYGTDDVATAMGVTPSDLAVPGIGAFEYRYMIDMFDFGTSVAFEPPVDAADITDAFLDLIQE